jgi:folylpolyglutamate synthase/dihydropteroate synthase
MAEILCPLCPLFDHTIFTQVNSPRAATLEELDIAFAAAGSETFETQPDAHAALARAQELTPNDGIIVGTGCSILGAVCGRNSWSKKDLDKNALFAEAFRSPIKRFESGSAISAH